MPDVFAAGEEIKQEAWEHGAWQDIGAFRPDPSAAQYRLQSFERRIEGRTFRLIVVYSSHLDARKQRTLDKALAREEESMTGVLEPLEATEFHCLADAQQRIASFRAEQSSEWFTWEMEVAEVTRPKKRSGRGRPKKGEPVPTETVYVPRRTA